MERLSLISLRITSGLFGACWSAPPPTHRELTLLVDAVFIDIVVLDSKDNIMMLYVLIQFRINQSIITQSLGAVFSLSSDLQMAKLATPVLKTGYLLQVIGMVTFLALALNSKLLEKN